MPELSDIESDFLNAFRCFSSLISEGFSIDESVGMDSFSRISNCSISRALLSKPFLILTGPSGTGKTRGAIRLAESLCEVDCRAVVAVGADWTDNRHVVGFLNPLQTLDGTPNGTPIYETTAILNLLLHANKEENRDKPHVLILDEMNLSHVERYFADFLSAMELHDKEKALKLHSAGLAKTREGEEVEGSIDFPENLFVIGTVNIDETTYMFSPKVLDRANVIEIHAEKTALENFLKGKAAEAGPEVLGYGISFLDAAQVIQNEQTHGKVPPLPPILRDAAADRLMELFEIMKRGRGEFGFRTGREVLAYLRTAYFLTPEADRAAWAAPEGDWLKALDAQILQKILPKLHGSRTRLAPLLGALATYCATGTKAYAMEHFPEGGNSPKRSLKNANVSGTMKFEHSYKKLERMIEVLVEEQFVSFIC
jgi:5-methylcytosine-specific restriction protein B